MKLARTSLTAALLALAPLAAAAQTPSARLASTLSQLNAASARFHNAQADFEWDYYERVVRDTSKQFGNIYFERKGATTEMGAVVRAPGSNTPQKVLSYDGGTLQVFDPGADHLDVLHAGANQATYEGFLTLGFGGSGHDLARTWNITDDGPETLHDGAHPIDCEKLDLVGKDEGVRGMFTHVTVWIDLSRGVSLKQVFYTPSGDIRTAVYSHIEVNGRLNKKPFAIKTDSHTSRSDH